METLSLLALSSILTSLIGVGASVTQQRKEFQQQNDLLSSQQDFTREREDIAYQRQSYATQYQQMLDAGFNPNIAAQALVDSGGQSISAGSSPSAPSVNSAVNALQSMIGQGGQNLYDMYFKNIEAQKVQAETEKTQIESGILPRDYQLRVMSADAQIRLWDASARKACKSADYDEEMTRKVQNENMFFGRMSEAQIEAYQAQVYQAVATAMNQLKDIEVKDSSIKNLDANTAVQQATEQNVREDTILKSSQNSETFYRSERERIAKEFEEKMQGIPLTADNQRMVQKWAADGDYESIRLFYQTIFSTALNQNIGASAGDVIGGSKTKLGILDYQGLSRNYKDTYIHYAAPFWNPQ